MHKQIMQEQEEFQKFAKQVAMASADDFAIFIPGAEDYLNVSSSSGKSRKRRKADLQYTVFLSWYLNKFLDTFEEKETLTITM